MGHRCCGKQKVKRGLWSPEEDEKLTKYITAHGHGCWSSIPKLSGLQRCGKSCRLRWINYLRPDLKRGSFTPEEEEIIIDVHRILGNRWAQIAKHLPGRTDNEVKNFWNSCIKKKLISQGLDPKTHNLLSSHQRASNKYNKAASCSTTSKNPSPASHYQRFPLSALSAINTSRREVSNTKTDATIAPIVAPPQSQTMPIPIYENQGLPSAWTVSEENSLANLPCTAFSAQNDAAVSIPQPPSSMNLSGGFGALEDDSIWVTNVEPLGVPRVNLPEQEKLQKEKSSEAVEVLDNILNMGPYYNDMEDYNFDNFVDSALMSGALCGQGMSPMDHDISWNF